MPDSVGSFGAVEVQRRGFTDRRLVSCPSEQCEVLLDVGYGLLPYPALYSLSAFRPVEVQVAALQGKEVRFLYAAHIDLRVLLQVMVERSRSGLHGTDDQEVRQRHTATSSTTVITKPAQPDLCRDSDKSRWIADINERESYSGRVLREAVPSAPVLSASLPFSRTDPYEAPLRQGTAILSKPGVWVKGRQEAMWAEVSYKWS